MILWLGAFSGSSACAGLAEYFLADSMSMSIIVGGLRCGLCLFSWGRMCVVVRLGL